MISRNKRNIGKRVRVVSSCKDWGGREGVVKGFRGDWGKLPNGKVSPYVNVYIYSIKEIWPMPGHLLERIEP